MAVLVFAGCSVTPEEPSPKITLPDLNLPADRIDSINIDSIFSSNNSSSLNGALANHPNGDQNADEIRNGDWLTTKSIFNLLNGNTANMTFVPGGNTTIVYFSTDGRVIAKNPDTRPFYVANWQVARGQWCMETNGPTICYKLKLDGDRVEGWHSEDGKRLKSVVFNTVIGDTADLVNRQRRKPQRQSNQQSIFTTAARAAGFLLFGAALVSTIMGDVGDPTCNPYCPGNERFVNPATGNWDAP